MAYFICHCMSLHVCLGAIFILDSLLVFLGRNCPLPFCLQCFDCDAVTLSASFPFGVLEREVLGNCIDS